MTDDEILEELDALRKRLHERRESAAVTTERAEATATDITRLRESLARSAGWPFAALYARSDALPPPPHPKDSPALIGEAVLVRRLWYFIRWSLLLTVAGVWTGFLLALLFPPT